MQAQYYRIRKSRISLVFVVQLPMLLALIFQPAGPGMEPAYADTSAECSATNPLIAVITIGSSHNAQINNAMQLKFIGHITNSSSLVSGVRSTVRICSNTTVAYAVLAANIDADPYPDARCFIDGRRVGNSGILRIGEHFVCHDPNSGDSDRIRIKQEF